MMDKRIYLHNISLNSCIWIKLQMIFVMFVITGMLCICGCGKKTANIQVFQYEMADDGTIHITGLTDKGKADSVLSVPAELDGVKVSCIDDGAFSDDYNVTRIIIGDGIEEVASSAFLNCVNLSEINFPLSVKKIGTNAVYNTAWERNQLDKSTQIIVNDILVEVEKGLTHYEIPGNVRVISSGTFYSNDAMESIIIPENVERIETYAFADCTSLQKVKLPSGIKLIEYCAFSNCVNADILVPGGAEIGKDAFLNVKNVSSY